MDSQCSDDIRETICKFDETFLKLLDVDGGWIKRLRYKGVVKKAKEFYVAYIKKCNEYNTYMDFFTPLLWYLIGCGYGYSKASAYLGEVRGKILEHLKQTVPSDMLQKIGEDFG